MTELRLYQRGRRPAEWTAHLAPGAYAVFLSDRKTRQPMRQDGSIGAGGSESVCWVFEGLSAARAFCMERTAAVPRMRAEVYDARGKVGLPVFEVSGDWHGGSPQDKRTAWWMTVGSVGLVALGITLIVRDVRHHTITSLPTYLGINCVLVAIRLIVWAYGIRNNLRRQAAMIAGGIDGAG